VQFISLLVVLVPGLALAEADNPLTNHLSASVGTFLLTTSTQLRVDGETGDGTALDAERDLGLHDADRFRFDAYWRFAKRHKIRGMYFDTKREATRVLDRQLQVGDTTFDLQAQLDSSLRTRVAELSYEYAFLQRKSFELTGSIGIHNLGFDLSMSATQVSSGQTRAIARSADADGPLPVVGLHGVWRLSDRFYVEGMAQFFRISFDPYAGRLEDYTASIVWMPFEHVGVGVGYNEFVTRVDVDANQFEGNLRWRYGGGRIFLVATF
jgi:hypothetical protein